jgi:hypothetical protein
MATMLIAYTGLTTWLLAWRGSSEAQFQLRVLRNEILMLAGVGISLILSNFPSGIGIR